MRSEPVGSLSKCTAILHFWGGFGGFDEAVHRGEHGDLRGSDSTIPVGLSLSSHGTVLGGHWRGPVCVSSWGLSRLWWGSAMEHQVFVEACVVEGVRGLVERGQERYRILYTHEQGAL